MLDAEKLEESELMILVLSRSSTAWAAVLAGGVRCLSAAGRSRSPGGGVQQCGFPLILYVGMIGEGVRVSANRIRMGTARRAFRDMQT